MESKQLDVRCPACRASLAVDVRTARVVRWSEEHETDPLGRPKVTERDWDAALGRVRSRAARARDLFESALDRERERERELAERFDLASERLSGGAGARPVGAAGRGLGLALALVELERESDAPAATYALDRAEALAVEHGPVHLLPAGRSSEAAAELARQGFHASGALAVWVRGVGERARAEVTPTPVRVDGRGLALAADLDEGEDPELGAARLAGALVEAERRGARTLAVRAAVFSNHEERLLGQGFALSHFEQVWSRTGR